MEEITEDEPKGIKKTDFTVKVTCTSYQKSYNNALMSYIFRRERVNVH